MKKGKEIFVFGAGGHGKVVVSTLIAAGFKIGAIYDDDPGRWGEVILDIPVSKPPAGTEGPVGECGIIGIGDNSVRRDFAQRYNMTNWITVIHPNAYVHPSVTMGRGTVVFAGAMIQPGTVIGEHCIVNTGATIDHDCIIGDFVHIAPGVNLAGGVRVGEGVLAGIGSVVMKYVSIGRLSTVGAGAVVAEDVPECVGVVGIPARKMRKKR